MGKGREHRGRREVYTWLTLLGSYYPRIAIVTDKMYVFLGYCLRSPIYWAHNVQTPGLSSHSICAAEMSEFMIHNNRMCP